MRFSDPFGITITSTVCRFEIPIIIPSPALIVSQISITEGGGAEGRGSYYDSTGVIRDVMQNREPAPE